MSFICKPVLSPNCICTLGAGIAGLPAGVVQFHGLALGLLFSSLMRAPSPQCQMRVCVLLVFVMKIREGHKSFQENCRAILQG